MKVLMRVNIFTCLVSLSSFVVLVRSAAVRQSREEYIEETKRRCNQNFRLYYDHGTENCEQCREICVNADIMGTEKQCQEHCSEYRVWQECMKKEDSFYDENVSDCTHCSTICKGHEAMGTLEQCRTKCSAYLAKQDPPQQVPSNQEVNSLKAIHGEEGTDSSSPTLHPGWIAAIVIGCVAVICTTLVIIVLVRTCSSQYTPAPQDEKQRQPVEETSQHGSSPHFAIPDPGSPRANLALSDMMDDGSRLDSQRPVLS